MVLLQVQSNVDILSDLPFNCHHDRTTTDWFIRSSAAFPTGNICGQFVAKKAIEGGDNPVVLSSQEDIQRSDIESLPGNKILEGSIWRVLIKFCRLQMKYYSNE